MSETTCFLYFCAQTSTPGATKVTVKYTPVIIVATGVDRGATRISDSVVIDNVTNACTAVEIPCESDQRYRLVAGTREDVLPKIDDAITETGRIFAQQRERVRILTGRQANVRQERRTMISPHSWIKQTLACWL